MKKTKALCALLVLVMVCSMLSGCGESGTAASDAASVMESEVESVPDTTPETEAVSLEEASVEEASAEEEILETEPQLQSVELPLFEETRSYTMFNMLPFFMSGLISDMSTDINTLRLLQENCNAKIEVLAVSDSVVAEQFNLMCSSGDYTDIIYGTSNYTRGYDAAITDEIIIDLMELAEEYAPNYLYYLETDPDLKKTLITDNGCLPTVATIYKEAGCENGGILIRSDWLNELGMDVPETYEELHDYIQACIKEYNTQGICIGNAMGENKANDKLYSFGYDFNAEDYNVVDGEVVFAYLNDSYYDYVKMLSEWYADGTIYSDFFNAQMGATDKYFASGACCLNTATAANLATIESYADPDYVYEMMPIGAPKLSRDDELHFSWTDTFARIKQQDTWAISTACQDPEGIMMMVNYLFSEEGQLMFNYGDEGHTFEYDDNGQPVYTELVTNNPDGLSYKDACYIYVAAVASGHMPSILDVCASYYYFDDSEWNVFDTFRSCDADGSYNMPTGVSLNEEENEEYASIASDVNTYAASEIMKFVLGQAELTEESFAEFQNTVHTMGGDRMEEIYQAAYDRFMAK